MNNSDYNTRMSRQLWMQYVLALLGWALAVLIMAAAAWYLCSISSFSGDPNDLTYRAIHWLHEYVALVYLIATGAGWLVISYRFIARPLRYLDALVDAAQSLTRPGEEPIALPPEMEQVQAQLNLARERALRSAMAAREAEQRKNDLVVYLAHDLKTPLTSVIGYLTLLRDEPDLPPEFRARYTGVALDRAERLEDLINEFFDITRFNLTHLELEKRPVDLTRMLQQVVSEFDPLLVARELDCALNLPSRLEYRCDPDKLARAFDNLVRNACYYSPLGAWIEISAGERAHDILLTFTNPGPTIPPEKLERLFEQFFRLDSSRDARTGGAGLGLAIAREIVELHGGTISAQSADGLTTFTVSLPSS